MIIIKKQNGAIAVLTALMVVVLAGFTGLAIDLWLVIYNQQKLQNAVDLAAMAATQEIGVTYGQVVSTAIHYSHKNGVSSSELTIIYPYNSDTNKLCLSASRNVPLWFVSIFGYKTKTVHAQAVAGVEYLIETSTTYQALNYAIFSGATTMDLKIEGNNSVVNGSIHGNKKIAVSGTNHNINGNLEAVSGISGDLSKVTGTIIKNAPVIPMPDLAFNSLASKASVIYNNDTVFSKSFTPNGVTLINGSCTLTDCKISGRGQLLVTGQVTISGNKLEYSTSDDLLAIYSLGSIRILSNNVNIHGILYAPNGTIYLDGNGNQFYGSLIANQILWVKNDITINGTYDLRAPQSLTVQKKTFVLYE